MTEWVIETRGEDGVWKAFGYAADEQKARQKAAKACLHAKVINEIRFRRAVE